MDNKQFVFKDYGITYEEIFERFSEMISALDKHEKPDLVADEVVELSQLMHALLCEKYGIND